MHIYHKFFTGRPCDDDDDDDDDDEIAYFNMRWKTRSMFSVPHEQLAYIPTNFR